LLYAHYYGEELKAIEIIKRNAEGEPKAVEHVDRFMELLAICFANIFTGLDPNVVVLGGGLSNFDLIYDEVPKRIGKHLLSVAQPPKIVKAKHGDAGGVRGFDETAYFECAVFVYRFLSSRFFYLPDLFILHCLLKSAPYYQLYINKLTLFYL